MKLVLNEVITFDKCYITIRFIFMGINVFWA